MGDAITEEFFHRVQEAAQGTPYRVTRTGHGFDLGLDLADATWYGLFNKAGLRRTVVHHVKVVGDRFTITDDSTEVRWEAGSPRTAGSATRELGRRIELGHETIWAVREDGSVGRVVDYRFSTQEGRDLVELVGKELGLSQGRGAAERIGLYAALSVPVLLVLVLLVVLVLWLAGVIPPE